jgi:hypothetical protein
VTDCGLSAYCLNMQSAGQDRTTRNWACLLFVMASFPFLLMALIRLWYPSCFILKLHFLFIAKLRPNEAVRKANILTTAPKISTHTCGNTLQGPDTSVSILPLSKHIFKWLADADYCELLWIKCQPLVIYWVSTYHFSGMSEQFWLWKGCIMN